MYLLQLEILTCEKRGGQCMVVHALLRTSPSKNRNRAMHFSTRVPSGQTGQTVADKCPCIWQPAGSVPVATAHTLTATYCSEAIHVKSYVTCFSKILQGVICESAGALDLCESIIAC